MGRERQKAKNRSGIARVTQKPKKTKKPLLANELIAKHWDRSATLSQNYAKLGLSSKINKATGGREANVKSAEELRKERKSRKDGLAINVTAPQFEVKEARIVRDPQTGAILSVEEEQSVGKKVEQGPYRALDDPLEALDNMVMDEAPMESDDDEEDATGPRAAHKVAAEFVKSLEREAAVPSAPKFRKQSDREKVFLKKLIAKHGTDESKGCYEKMAKDLQLNIMQQSPGDLRQRVRRFLGIKGAG